MLHSPIMKINTLNTLALPFFIFSAIANAAGSGDTPNTMLDLLAGLKSPPAPTTSFIDSDPTFSEAAYEQELASASHSEDMCVQAINTHLATAVLKSEHIIEMSHLLADLRTQHRYLIGFLLAHTLADTHVDIKLKRTIESVLTKSQGLTLFYYSRHQQELHKNPHAILNLSALRELNKKATLVCR